MIFLKLPEGIRLALILVVENFCQEQIMKCHIWSLKIIYESQCVTSLRIIRNVRPNTTTEKKILDSTVWVQTSIFLLIFTLYYSFIPQYSWKSEDHCYLHSGLLQATILTSSSAKVYLTWWPQLVINFGNIIFRHVTQLYFVPFIYLFAFVATAMGILLTQEPSTINYLSRPISIWMDLSE